MAYFYNDKINLQSENAMFHVKHCVFSIIIEKLPKELKIMPWEAWIEWKSINMIRKMLKLNSKTDNHIIFVDQNKKSRIKIDI